MAVKKFRVRNLGEIGVVKDVPPFDLPPNAWSDAQNVRFKKTHIEKMQGYLPVLTGHKPDGMPLACFERANSDKKIYATGTKLFEVQGDSYNEVTPDGVTFGASMTVPWTYTTLSNAVIMNNSHDDPVGMTPNSTKFETLPGWGKPKMDGSVTRHWKCQAVRAYKSYLVALNMTEEGVELPQRVRWSDVAYINELPQNWWEDSQTNDGGFNDLADCDGGIVDGRSLRDSFIIYTNKETYVMNYVGGINVFSFSKLFADSGVLAPDCVADFEGKHFVISEGDIFIHNGSDKTQVASNVVKQYLIDEISKVNPKATRVVAMPNKKEIWVCYVAAGSSGTTGDVSLDTSRACNKAAIWNWEFNTWTFYDLPNIVNISIMTAPSTGTLGWSQDTDQWGNIKDPEHRIWRSLGSDFAKKVLFTCSTDGCLYVLDFGTTLNRWDDVNKTFKPPEPVICTLERESMDLDEVVEDTLSYKLIRKVVPQISGVGSIGLRIGGAQDPNIVPTYTEYQMFDIVNDTKFDTFANNRYPAMKFIDNQVGDWRFTGYDLHIVEGGTR